MMPLPDWLPPRIRWECWTRNGDVCITNPDPPFRHGVRLASCLAWMLREFASRCRRVHDEAGVLPLLYAGPKTPSTLALAMALWFDLALWDPRLVRERVRGRGGDPGAGPWPVTWFEGSVYDSVIVRDPFPAVGTPRRKLVLLAKEQQVIVPSRGARIPERARRVWSRGLDAVASVAEGEVASILGEDEPGFLLNLLVLVHEQPGTAARPRPSLEASYRRHEALVPQLVPVAEAKGLPVEWHALWRLPPAMTWSTPGGRPWMRYPAVSLVAAARPLQP